jgi:hypothetical protein
VRRGLLLSIGLPALVVFLAITFVLARMFSGYGSERDAVIDVIRAQARGDVPATVAGIHGCAGRPACSTRVARIVRRTKRPGRVSIVRLDLGGRLGLGAHEHTARVVWKAGDSPPVVQCVRVGRTGDVISGFDAYVRSLGAVIDSEKGC